MTPASWPKLDDEFLAVLRSPTNGKPLRRVGACILSDGEEEWPCLAGIPFLRTGRETLRNAVLEAIRSENLLDALSLLLSDRKDDTIPPPDFQATQQVARQANTISEAMEGLSYGGMAPYVYHRWCLPTFLSGLALLEAHAPHGAALLEVGCGTGHFLRSWHKAGGTSIGADLVFSNLWLARRFVAPQAQLVCFDVNGVFPLASQCVDVVFSHDAFHYFRNKDHVLQEMRRLSTNEMVLLGHVHNATQSNFSPGLPLRIDEYIDSIHPSAVYDDAALTRAALTGVAKSVADEQQLAQAQAFAFVCGTTIGPTAQLTVPAPGTLLRLNPLLTSEGTNWPTEQIREKFQREFVEDWEFLKELESPPASILAAAQKGMLDLSENTTGQKRSDCWYARQRVVLDLPEGW